MSKGEGFLLGLVIGVLVSLSVCTSALKHVVRKRDNELIKRGYKVYDNQTGFLKWKENKK